MGLWVLTFRRLWCPRPKGLRHWGPPQLTLGAAKTTLGAAKTTYIGGRQNNIGGRQNNIGGRQTNENRIGSITDVDMPRRPQTSAKSYPTDYSCRNISATIHAQPMLRLPPSSYAGIDRRMSVHMSIRIVDTNAAVVVVRRHDRRMSIHMSIRMVDTNAVVAVVVIVPVTAPSRR